MFDTKKENDDYVEDHKSYIITFKEQLKNLPFDIIKWNGKPYTEKVLFEIFTIKLENWTD